MADVAPPYRRERVYDYVRLLVQLFGPDGFIQPPARKLPAPRQFPALRERISSKGMARHRIEYAKRIIRFTSAAYGIETQRIAIRLIKLEAKAGQITCRNGTWYVALDARLSKDGKKLTSIIAHELANGVDRLERLANAEAYERSLLLRRLGQCFSFGSHAAELQP
ncbi:MAG: hypothetical protein ABI205_08995 [Gemmatimonadaceae bacterium]